MTQEARTYFANLIRQVEQGLITQEDFMNAVKNIVFEEEDDESF